VKHRQTSMTSCRQICATGAHAWWLLASLLPSPAPAASGWTDFVRVAELVPTSKHYYEVRLPVSDNPSGCREKIWFYQNYDSPGAEQMFDVLLESLTADIRLRVYVTGVCNISGYAEFSSISVTR